MSTTESLHLQLETTHTEVQQLEVENWRLRELNPRRAEVEDQESTMQRLKELYEQAFEDLQDQQQELEASAQQVDGLCDERNKANKLWEAQVMRLAELEGETRHLSEKEMDLGGSVSAKNWTSTEQ